MQDLTDKVDVPLTGLDMAQWKDRLTGLAQELGEFRSLGPRHFSTLIRRSDTLLVTFETVQGIRALSETATPFGFEMVSSHGWSHLCLISNGDTWFRASQVYDYFDELIDDGLFDGFEQVVFYGAGPCGYAAAAYSVAAPGATVVAVQPQATLDPDMAGWDPRFSELRRLCFTDRYGYAPDMLDAAERAFILYDPRQEFDAMHAALYARPNVTRLRMPHMGAALQTQLIEMDILYPILDLAGQDRLTSASFYRLYRARRDNPSYLRSLMGWLDGEDRAYLNMMLCSNVSARLNAPKFRRRLDALRRELGMEEPRASAG